MAIPSPPFHSIDTLSPQQQSQFCLFSRGATVPLPYQVVHHAFEAIADQNPQVTAVRNHDGATITYAELEARANILANELCCTYKLQKGDRVVLLYSRCIELVISILAVLKAGGQYLPLDAELTPTCTLGHAIYESRAQIVLCLPPFRAKAEQSVVTRVHPDSHVKVVGLDSQSSLWGIGDRQRLNTRVGPQDGAYAIYTSGTTDQPKSVDVRHQGVCNSLLAEPSKLGITVGTNVIQQLNVGFDMCAWEILGTMVNGGTLHLRGSGNESWAECLRRVDVVIATPSIVLSQMARQQDFPNIKTIAVGGEPCPRALAEHWASRVKFYNVYGSAEVSILISAHLHTRGSALSIGRPNPNTNIYILDESENPVPIGEPGIMWAGGLGVSRGYLNLPEATSALYKPDKFTRDGSNMFCTGDLARWLPDGSLESLGRKKDQVKIAGYHVALDQVSKSIEDLPSVTRACTLEMDKSLWGFYSAPRELSLEARKRLTVVGQSSYAVPSVWKFLPVIDLTPNGKIDKTKLRYAASATRTSHEKEIFTNGCLSPLSGTSTLSVSVQHNVGDRFDESKDVERYALPPKKGFHGWRWIRYKAISAYRKIFLLVFIANLIPFAIMLHVSRRNRFLVPLSTLLTAVSVNILAAVLIRQNDFLNLLYWLATRPPLSTPFFIRYQLALIYHNGGIHSGCAASALVWWSIFTVQVTRFRNLNATPNPAHPHHVNTATITLSYFILAFICMIVVMAYPAIRARYHNQFEWTHRFAGWTLLGFFWAHLFIVTASLSEGRFGITLLKTREVYINACSTICIAYPWMRLRRINVVPERLSAHAVRLHFNYFTPRRSSSVVLRISDRPLREWHSFAAISVPGVKGFSVIVSRAGDWTGKIIDNPPTSIWTRGVPTSGVLAVVPLFKKMVLVATGSGVAPCMPVMTDNVVPLRILWSTKDPMKTYGRDVLDTVYGADPHAVIWNTDTQGRPDLAALAYQLFRESDAEVVCIISNPSTTSRFMYQMECRGVPAIAPIFDS